MLHVYIDVHLCVCMCVCVCVCVVSARVCVRCALHNTEHACMRDMNRDIYMHVLVLLWILGPRCVCYHSAWADVV